MVYTGPGCLSGYSTVAIMLVPDHPSVPVGFDYPVPVFTSTALVETCISISLVLVYIDHTVGWCSMLALVFIGVDVVGTQSPNVPCHFLIPAIGAALFRNDTPTLALLDPHQLPTNMTSSSSSPSTVISGVTLP